jgi:AcrR family transcriptional regulator
LLILTAERLFAERGISAVSLREVAEAAGQRGNGVAQYYFGDRETLLTAIFEHRAVENNARRLALLDQLERSDNAVSPRALINALVRPLSDQLEAGNHYVGVLARLETEFGEPRVQALRGEPFFPFAQVSRENGEGFIRLRQWLRSFVPECSDALFNYRLGLTIVVMVHGLANLDVARIRRSRTMLSLEESIEGLIDVMTAMMTYDPTGYRREAVAIQQRPGVEW